MEYFTLSNGTRIPAIGSGTNTFAKVTTESGTVYDGHTDEVVSAIRAGYRFFDTAESYGNEEAVGAGILESGIGRENIFISTKMKTRNWGQETSSVKPEDAEAAIARSLEKLKTDYIDLYLLHMPWGNKEETAEVWKVLEDYCDKGILRAIGISNFTEEDLSDLLAHCRIRPMVNQFKIAPDRPNEDLVAYCQENGITPMAWGPLKFESDRSAIDAIAEKHGKNWAQVILRRNFQKGIVSIPKSHSFEHQKENLDIFDFALSDEELAAI
ncbi:MAG: aldo/keto reductase [Oscillospiraceae bacterium]|nr:aldo/keto reductase [Oscillospiraceae bacterium]